MSDETVIDKAMSIGTFARVSGLTVSALRFYDGVDVLSPARVDPESGYRWYFPDQLDDARLLARLRRVGLPVAEMRLLLTRPVDPALVAAVLEEHLRRLEDGLADARVELERIREQVTGSAGQSAVATVLKLAAGDFVEALCGVRFALPSEPDAAVDALLFHVGAGRLTLVATDRYRMAVAAAPVAHRTGPHRRVAVSTARLPQLDGLESSTGDLEVRLDDAGVHIAAGATRGVQLAPASQEFPDYERIVRVDGIRQIRTRVEDLRTAVEEGPLRYRIDDRSGAAAELVVLGASEAGRVVVLEEPDHRDFAAVVNRRFLLDALSAGTTEDLVLEFNAPARPLAIRFPAEPDRFSVLMPTRLA